MPVHYEKDKPSCHQNEGCSGNKLTEKSIPVFTLQLFINGLNDQDRQVFIDFLIEAQNFRPQDDSRMLMPGQQLYVNFTIGLRHVGLVMNVAAFPVA